MKPEFIALLTDFGLEDHYVASLKGVILSINPKIRIIDLTHQIRPQNIRQGAFVLREVCPCLPNGTIVVAVVDPGVGTSRKAVCVKTANGYLIGPDNGLLSMTVAKEKKNEIRTITNHRYWRHPVSNTFHGRDIFAPVAAHLSRRNIFTQLGPRLRRLTELKAFAKLVTRQRLIGAVEYIDRFGNAITNISAIDFNKVKLNRASCKIKIKQKLIKGLDRCFADRRAGKLVALINSSDLLEIALPNASAAQKFRLKVGDKVFVNG